MSSAECNFALSAAYSRATSHAARGDLAGIRRAFRAALRAAGNGDARPTVLILARYP